MRNKLYKLSDSTIRIKKTLFGFLPILAVLFLLPCQANAHCDQMNGPLIKDAQRAIKENNVNIVLKWVPAEDEVQIKEIFDLVTRVRVLNDDARLLADRYFYDVLVRVHRIAEGAAFTGVKPEGTPVDEKVMAADKAIETGNLAPLMAIIPENDRPELKKRFERAMALKEFDDNDVTAGREYIHAYVQFFKFAEGDTEHLTNAHRH